MTAIIDRNLKLFFRNRVGVFFSILSSLIVLLLYIVFLKHNMIVSWHQISRPTRLLDPWLIGGMLSVTAVTTTLDGVRQYVTDQERVAVDFEIAPVSEFKYQLAYGISAFIIGVMMQIVVFIVNAAYFGLADGVYFGFSTDVKLFLVCVENTLVTSLISMALATWVKSIDTWSTMESIVATASGFLSGIYIPIGSLPRFAQTLIKFYPGAYSASLYRRILMNEPMNHVFLNNEASVQRAFQSQLGIGYMIHGVVTTFGSEFMVTMLFGGLAVAFIVIKIAVEHMQERRLRYN